MGRVLTVFTLGLAGAGLLAATGASPALAACPAGSKDKDARVQLWSDANCSGGSRQVLKTAPDDDRPDFKAFPSGSGTVDINNDRSSVAVQANFCVRLFDYAKYGGATSNLYCAGSPGPSYFNLRDFDERATSMRVCPTTSRAACNKDGVGAEPTDTTQPDLSDPGAEDTGTPGDDPFADPGAGEPGAGGDPGANDPFADPGPDPFAEGSPDGGGSGAELGPLGPNDGLRFDRRSRRCSHGSTRGARALRVWVDETGISQRGTASIYRCSKQTSRRDLHANGRAVDVQPSSTDDGQQLVALLLANDYALARRMGVQEIIFAGQVWSSAKPTPLPRRYRGRSPHRRSVHIGLNKKGAAMQTSFWQGR